MIDHEKGPRIMRGPFSWSKTGERGGDRTHGQLIKSQWIMIDIRYLGCIDFQTLPVFRGFV